jgi:dihydrolipoamide dehydrogenase
MAKKYDIAVLGAGPGGMAAATHAATQGQKVALVNAAKIWGHGLHGAYKSKGMYELARAYRMAQQRGWGYAPGASGVDFQEMSEQLVEGTNTLENIYIEQIKRFNIDEFRGEGKFIDPHHIRVGEEILEAKFVIIATGTRPRIPPHIAPDGKYIMTPDAFTRNTRSLKSIVILGAGIIGCEFAAILNALGVEVHLIDNKSAILNHEDEDIYGFLNRSFIADGIKVYPETKALSMQVDGETVKTELACDVTLVTEGALVSTGRMPNSEKLNLASINLPTDKHNYILVDGFTQTEYPHIYAVGDVAHRTKGLDMALVHVAEAEARCAVNHILGSEAPLRLNHIPFIIFTMPMIAGAGLNEKEARQRFSNPRVAKYEYVRNHRAHAMRYFEGFVKLIVGPEGDDRILGVRAIGPMADTLIGEVSVLIEHEIPYTKLLNSIHAHPSLSESLLNAARLIDGSLKL